MLEQSRRFPDFPLLRLTNIGSEGDLWLPDDFFPQGEDRDQPFRLAVIFGQNTNKIFLFAYPDKDIDLQEKFKGVVTQIKTQDGISMLQIPRNIAVSASLAPEQDNGDVRLAALYGKFNKFMIMSPANFLTTQFVALVKDSNRITELAKSHGIGPADLGLFKD